MTDHTTAAADEAVRVLSRAGAMCGVCGDEPGDQNCPDCDRVRRGYVEALLAAGWKPATPLPVSEARMRLLQALDASYCQALGHTPEGLLAAYEASRTQTVDDSTLSVAEARDRLRGMALTLATGEGPLVEPWAFNQALDDYQAAVAAAVLPTANHDTDTSTVLREAIARVRKIPVQCTGLTGPVWFGQGWKDAIREFEEIAERWDDDRPLSPFYEHPECGFHWHGRDGMDIPVQEDGQPVCPRCELAKVQKQLDYTQKRRDEVGAECKRRGKRVLEQSERVIALERQVDELQRQLGVEIRRAGQAEAMLRRVADETAATEADTLPSWLHWRFGPHGQPWAEVPDEDKALWEYQARAVRRAVARGGFKQRAAGARQDGAQQ